MDNIFHPGLLIAYHQSKNSVLVFTFNLAGEKHFGLPRELKWDRLPLLLFQLADRGYVIHPEDEKNGFKQLYAFSPEFVQNRKALEKSQDERI